MAGTQLPKNLLQEAREGDHFLDRLLTHYLERPNQICGHILDPQGDIQHTLTYGSWVSSAAQLAEQLRALGIKQGDIVLISLPTSREFLASMVALWWIGAIPVPVPELASSVKTDGFYQRILQIIWDCDAKTCITNSKCVVQLSQHDPSLRDRIQFIAVEDLPSTWQNVETPLSVLNPNSPNSNDIAFIQYTSGSTSQPKGVVVTQAGLAANLQCMQLRAPFRKIDKLLNWMPLYHDMGLVGGLLLNAFVQCQFYLMSPFSFIRRPAVWLEAISKHRITISTGPNFAYDICAKRVDPTKIPNLDLSSWRLAYNGAEFISTKTVTQFTDKFAPYGFSAKTHFPVYGMAETTLAGAFPVPGEGITVDTIQRLALRTGQAVPADQGDDSIQFISVGDALPFHTICIKDPTTDMVLPDRTVGEICISGPSVSPGYFVRSAGKPKNMMNHELKTGDLGYLANHHLFIVDRIKDMIIIGGKNYYPVDLESQIEAIEGVRAGKVIAFGQRNEDQGTEGLVLVVGTSGAAQFKPVLENVKRTLYERFQLVAKDVVLLSSRMIPLTSSGKKRRLYCKELYEDGKLERFEIG